MRDLWLYFIVALFTCATPGAGVLMTVTSAFRFGRERTFIAPSGNAFGVLVISALSAVGLGAVITSSPLLFNLLQVAGALVLAWMGWKNWRAKPLDLSGLSGVKQGSTGQASRIFMNSALLQVTNPMLFVFLISLMPPFIRPGDDYAASISILIGIFVLTCLAVHLAYSYTACFASKWLHGKCFSFWLNHVSAALFWLCAAGVLWRTLQPLL